MGKLVGIGGLSRAGKSTLAKLLVDRLILTGHSANIIHQDDYVVPVTDLSMIRDKRDWERPDSIDWMKLKLAVDKALPKYDYVFIEGLFAYYDRDLYNQMDKRFFIEISKLKFLERKRVDLRWGSMPEPAWYMDHIWESYLRYGRPTLNKDFIIFNGSRFFDIDFAYSELMKS